MVPSLEQEASHHEVGLWVFGRFGSLEHWSAETSQKLICPCASNPSQQLDSLLSVAPSPTLLMQPRVKGHLNGHSERDLVTTVTLPSAGKGCVQVEDHVARAPLWNLRPSIPTIRSSQSVDRCYSPLSQMTAVRASPKCECHPLSPRVRFFLRVWTAGFVQSMSQALWSIWSPTFLQLPGMLLSNPTSYQEDEKRYFPLTSHGGGSAALRWPRAGEFSAKRFCSHGDTGKVTRGGDKRGAATTVLVC